MKADDAKRLKELEKENQRLKKIVADQALDRDMLKELNRGKISVGVGTVHQDRRARTTHHCDVSPQGPEAILRSVPGVGAINAA
jgi:hypothetical protein